jgi:hypothetical protein
VEIDKQLCYVLGGFLRVFQYERFLRVLRGFPRVDNISGSLFNSVIRSDVDFRDFNLRLRFFC